MVQSSPPSIDRALLQIVDELAGELDLDRLEQRLRRVLLRLLDCRGVWLGEAGPGPPVVRPAGADQGQVAFTLPADDTRVLEVRVDCGDGDPAGARELVERVHPLLVRMWRSAAEFALLRRRFESDPDRADDPLPAALCRRGLTARQSEILIAVAHGRSNRDVAGDLGLSDRTIQKHLENCYRRLGVTGRSEAARVVWSLAAEHPA